MKEKCFHQIFYQKMMKGGRHRQKHMIPTQQFRFPISMTSQIKKNVKSHFFEKLTFTTEIIRCHDDAIAQKYLFQNVPR